MQDLLIELNSFSVKDCCTPRPPRIPSVFIDRLPNSGISVRLIDSGHQPDIDLFCRGLISWTVSECGGAFCLAPEVLKPSLISVCSE